MFLSFEITTNVKTHPETQTIAGCSTYHHAGYISGLGSNKGRASVG